MVRMDRLEPKRGQWRRMRWGWLAISILGLLFTPSAIIDAVDTYKTDHSVGWIIPLAFAIRFGQIWLFAWLWWKSRPSSPETNPSI